MCFNIQVGLIRVAALGRRRKKAGRGHSIIDTEISSPETTCAGIVAAQIELRRGALPCPASFDTPSSLGSFGPLRFGVRGLFFCSGEHAEPGQRKAHLESLYARTKQLLPGGTLTIRPGHSGIGTIAARFGVRVPS